MIAAMHEKEPGSPFTFSGTYGPLLRPFMRRLFSPINVPELYRESIAILAEQGHIVYAHASKSSMDALLLNFRLKRVGLPTPTLIFGSTFPLFQPVMKAVWGLMSRFMRSSPFDKGFYNDFMRGGERLLIYLDHEPPTSPRPRARTAQASAETIRHHYITTAWSTNMPADSSTSDESR